MDYRIHILGPAKKSLKNFDKIERNIARDLINGLKSDPRPPGYEKVVDHDGVLRVKQRNIRVIYGVFDQATLVFILDVRRRNEATYRHIPTQALSLAVSQAMATLKTKPVC